MTVNRTRDDFVERWKRHIAGMALFGTVSELRDGPMVRAAKILEIPAQVEDLLGKMYDDLTRDRAFLSVAVPGEPKRKA